MMTKKKMKCERCGERFQPSVRGRPQRFCSPSCRQAAYLERQERLSNPEALLARDLNHWLVRDAMRQVVWDLLRQIGAVQEPKPPPPTDPPRPIIQETLRRAGLGNFLDEGNPRRKPSGPSTAG
jgi:hypothetical protein